MALYKNFPKDKFTILKPEIRWFPADEALREQGYEKLLPPFVPELRKRVKQWRDENMDIFIYSIEAIVMKYKDLWKVEDAFGEIKGPTLRARPAFHWTDERIIGHLCLCFLAYLCEAHLTKLLRRKEAVLTS